MTSPAIRRARVEDAADCARLILESAHEFLPAVFGPGIAHALELFAGRPGNLFSHAHAWIAEDRGMTKGMLLGYSKKEKTAEDPRTGLMLLYALGPSLLMKLGRLLRLQGTTGFLTNSSYYISNIAVYPEYRGMGIGAALISKALEEARKKGCSKAALDVETDNEGAFRLYSRLGFKVLRQPRALVIRGRPFPFYRMELAL
jgi:ribosomal protein S18 acetylase RimI-like enzyme